MIETVTNPAITGSFERFGAWLCLASRNSRTRRFRASRFERSLFQDWETGSHLALQSAGVDALNCPMVERNPPRRRALS